MRETIAMRIIRDMISERTRLYYEEGKETEITNAAVYAECKKQKISDAQIQGALRKLELMGEWSSKI